LSCTEQTGVHCSLSHLAWAALRSGCDVPAVGVHGRNSSRMSGWSSLMSFSVCTCRVWRCQGAQRKNNTCYCERSVSCMRQACRCVCTSMWLMCLCVSVCACVSVSLCVSVCLCACVCLCVPACLRVSVVVCLYVGVSVCLCVSAPGRQCVLLESQGTAPGFPTTHLRREDGRHGCCSEARIQGLYVGAVAAHVPCHGVNHGLPRGGGPERQSERVRVEDGGLCVCVWGGVHT
jgi:hypothetical protein